MSLDFAELEIRVNALEARAAGQDLDQLERSGTKAETRFKGLAAASREFGAVLGALGIVGVGATIIKLTQETARFQNALAEVATQVDETVWSMQALSDEAQKQAKAFGSTPLQQVKAYYEIISAGATDAASATETLTAANKLAVGGITDTATAADVLTSVLNAYGPAVGSAAEVSDALFIAVRNGKTTMEEMAANVGKVAPIASQLGVTFDELTGSIAALTSGGIATAEAATGVRAILASVAKPSQEAAELAEKLGLNFSSAGIQAKGFAGFLNEVKEKTGGSQDALATLFGGVEALVPMLALSGQAGENFTATMEDMANKAGATEAAFNKIAESPGFKWNQLLAAIEVEAMKVGTAMLTVLVPAMTFVTDNLGTLINLLGAAVAGYVAYQGWVLAAAAAQAIMSGSLGVHIALLITTARTLGIAAAAQVAATGATAAFGVVLRAVISTALGPIGIALTAAAIAYQLLRGETERTGVANAQYTASQKQASEAVKVASGLELQLVTATGSARAAIIAKMEANRAEVITNGYAAVQNLRRAETELILAQSIAQRKTQEAGAWEASGAWGAIIGRLTGVHGAAEAAQQKVADLQASIGALRGTVVESDAALQTYNRALAGAAAGAAKITPTLKDASKASKALKADVDPLVKSLANLEKSVNEVERDLEKMFKREEPTEGPLDFIEKGAREAEKLVEKLDALSDTKLRITFFKNEENREATREMIDNLDAIANRATDVASVMREAFGGLGGVFGDLIANATDYAAVQEKMAAEVKAGTRTQISMNNELAGMQARNTAQMIGGVKSLFKEKSAAYKAMDAIEKIHAALQFANMVKALAMDATRTTTEVATAGVRATAKGAEGAASIFAALGPFGFPVVAAMVAVLAAMGVKGLGGGSGGGSSVKPPSAEELQAGIGTGTVFGDGGAQSESLSKALDIIAENTNRDLEYSNESVRLLRDISSGINKMAGLIGQQLSISGGIFDTGSFNLGKSGSSGLLGLIGGSSTTRTLYDQGLETFTQTVGDILAQGVNAQVYNVIEQVKKKSGFLGIGGGTKTTYQNVSGEVPAAIEAQFQAIVGDITASVIAFGNQLGIDVAEQVKNVALPATKLSFLDMSGEEIQDALEAYFSSIADTIATTLNGTDGLDLSALQRAGEGLYETLARVVRTLTTVNVSLSSIGMGPLSVGGNSGVGVTAPAADNLAGLFGGLDEFQDAVSAFSEKFLTEAERMAPVINAVRGEMARLGAAGVTTNDQFKQLVLGLDLGTTSGQEMFASLMAVAPAFAKVTEYLGSLDNELGETGKTAAQLAAIAKQSRSLDIQLMEALGDTAGALAAKRADELAAMDESLRGKQQEVWAALDAAEAARVLSKANEDAANIARALAEKRSALEIKIMELSGDAAGALAARRAIELASLDESLRPLQERIYALEDERTKTEAANEALRTAQELANTRRSMEIQIMELSGDAAGALAATRALELASLDPSLRALKERIYALEDEKAATEAAAEAARNARELAQTGREMEIRIMELSGDAAGALAARRALELAALDPSLTALQLRIYALEDEKTAIDAVAEAERIAAGISTERRGLEIRLMEASGDAHGALNARRQDELNSVDASNRALLEMIFTAEDARAAQQALADAQNEAARAAQNLANLNIRLLEAQGNDSAALAARRQLELSQATDDATRALLREIYAAEDAAVIRAKNEALAKQAEQDAAAAAREAEQLAKEAAQRAQEIANQRASLEIELMRALGNESGALAAQRARELAGMDESLRALQSQVWAAQDAAKAQEELAKAQADAAAKAEQLAKERQGLQIRILELEGNTAAATALKRQQELAALDASLRPLQLRIYALEDAKAAEEAHAAAVQEAADKVEKARDILSAAYNREAGALRDTMERFKGFSNSLREFRASLTVGSESLGDAYRYAQAAFVDTAAAARRGDEKALGSLAETSKAFLAASMDNAGSLLEYQRDVLRVQKATDAAIGAADEAANYAQLQLDALDRSVAGLLQIDNSVISVRDAIDDLLEAVAAQNAIETPQPVQVVPPTTTNQAPTVTSDPGVQTAIVDLRAEIANLTDGIVSVATHTSKTAQLLDTIIIENALTVRTDEDAPLDTKEPVA